MNAAHNHVIADNFELRFHCGYRFVIDLHSEIHSIALNERTSKHWLHASRRCFKLVDVRCTMYSVHTIVPLLESINQLNVMTIWFICSVQCSVLCTLAVYLCSHVMNESICLTLSIVLYTLSMSIRNDVAFFMCLCCDVLCRAYFGKNISYVWCQVESRC